MSSDESDAFEDAAPSSKDDDNFSDGSGAAKKKATKKAPVSKKAAQTIGPVICEVCITIDHY